MSSVLAKEGTHQAPCFLVEGLAGIEEWRRNHGIAAGQQGKIIDGLQNRLCVCSAGSAGDVALEAGAQIARAREQRRINTAGVVRIRRREIEEGGSQLRIAIL